MSMWSKRSNAHAAGLHSTQWFSKYIKHHWLYCIKRTSTRCKLIQSNIYFDCSIVTHSVKSSTSGFDDGSISSSSSSNSSSSSSNSSSSSSPSSPSESVVSRSTPFCDSILIGYRRSTSIVCGYFGRFDIEL